METPVIQLNTTAIRSLYCLNDIAYLRQIHLYTQLMINDVALPPIEIFQQYLVDLRMPVYVIKDGTHRALAALSQGIALPAILSEAPNFDGNIYKLIQIPLCNGDEQIVLRKKGSFF